MGVEDPHFAYGLLMELTRAFLAYADNVQAQDSASYAIQVRDGFLFESFLLKVFQMIHSFKKGLTLKIEKGQHYILQSIF